MLWMKISIFHSKFILQSCIYLFVLFSRGFKSRRMDNCYNSGRSIVGSHNNNIDNNPLHSQEKMSIAKTAFKQAVSEMPI